MYPRHFMRLAKHFLGDTPAATRSWGSHVRQLSAWGNLHIDVAPSAPVRPGLAALSSRQLITLQLMPTGIGTIAAGANQCPGLRSGRHPSAENDIPGAPINLPDINLYIILWGKKEHLEFRQTATAILESGHFHSRTTSLSPKGSFMIKPQMRRNSQFLQDFS